MNGLLPARPSLGDRRWWGTAGAIGLVALIAALLSYAIALTDLGITPILLVPGVGVALLTRFGRSFWPAVAIGDALGQWIMSERSLSLVLVSVAIHAAVCVLGASWLQRGNGGWLRDLASSMRFAGVAAVISIAGGVAATVATVAHGAVPAGQGVATIVAWLMLGYMAGFLVGGAFLLAWTDPSVDIAAELHHGIAAAFTVLVLAIGALGFLVPVGIAVPLALLGALGIAGRAGIRWGTLAILGLTALAIWGADRGFAPFGGQADGEEAVNTMLAVTLFAAAVIMLSGYREGGEDRQRPAIVVAAIFAVLMLVAGISSLAANAVAMDRDTPFVLSGLLALGAALGLGILRASRRPAQPSTARGIALAVAAGAIYVVNLSLYLQAVPEIGSGTATILSMAAPLAVVLLTMAVYRTRPSWGVVVAVAVIITGVLTAASGAMGEPLGVALALGSAVVFALSLIFTQAALSRANVIDVSLASAVAAAVVALTVGLVLEGTSAFILSPQQIGELALGALGAQLVPILGRSWALSRISANVVGAEGVLAPVATALLSFALLDAVTTGGEVTGLILITLGALIATFAGSRRGSAAHAEGPV
jgi:drug/metabolite transporter (DMT)-like permease